MPPERRINAGILCFLVMMRIGPALAAHLVWRAPSVGVLLPVISRWARRQYTYRGGRNAQSIVSITVAAATARTAIAAVSIVTALPSQRRSQSRLARKATCRGAVRGPVRNDI